MYSPLPSSSTAEQRPNEDDPWRGTTPVTGLRNLARMSIVIFLVCLVNVGLQGYVTASMKESGTAWWDRTEAGSVWAASIAAFFALYLLIVAHTAQSGLKSVKFHLVFGIVGNGIATCLLLAGLVMTAVTAANIGTVKADDGHICVYYNNTYPYGQPPAQLPSGCSDCDSSESWAEGVALRTCCCCYSQVYFSGYQTMSFFKVNSCAVVFDELYPISTASAVLYGVACLLVFVVSITGCVVGCCQCRSCSAMCGPFSRERNQTIITAGGWRTNIYGTSGYNQVVVAAPVTGQPIVATPVYAAQGTAPPAQPYYGGEPQPAQAPCAPNTTAPTSPADFAGATATTPPSYNDALAHKKA